MLKRKMVISCGRRCKQKVVAYNPVTIKEVEIMARHLGWLISDDEWLIDLCPKHWEEEQQRRIKMGYSIIKIPEINQGA